MSGRMNWQTGWVGFWARSEEPGSRRRTAWAFDAAVALFALLTWSTYAFGSSRFPTWGVAAIVGAMVAPLIVRRIWPVPVFTWSVAVAAVFGWWTQQTVWSPVLLIALYTVAARCSRRTTLIAAGALTVGTVVAAIHVFPANWYLSAGALVAMVVAVTALGLYLNTRRALLTEVRDRADRLERERDQQVALAAAAERERIAREMHDIVAHHLTVMVALADGAAAQSARSPERAEEAMRTVSATGRVALADTRRLLGVLRDHTDDRAARSPLPDLSDLDDLIDRVRTAGLSVRYEVAGRRPAVSPTIALTVYRIVQEALTNAMKHASAHCAVVARVGYAPLEVSVEVEDDGAGAVSSTGLPGRGLTGMAERVSAAGGELGFGPRPGRGWFVRARLPVGGADSVGAR